MEHVKLLRKEIEEQKLREMEHNKLLEILAYFLIKMENFFEPENYKPLQKHLTNYEIKEKLIRLENFVTNNARKAQNSEKFDDLIEQNRDLRTRIAELNEERRKESNEKLDNSYHSRGSSVYQEREVKKHQVSNLEERIRMIEESLLRKQEENEQEGKVVRTLKSMKETRKNKISLDTEKSKSRISSKASGGKKGKK